MSGRSFWHALLCATVMLLGIWAGLRWALIADQVDARVTELTWAEEGPSLKVLKLDDGRALTIDDDLMTRMHAVGPVEGQRLQVERGHRIARLDGEEVPLRWSWTSTRMMVLLGVIVGVSVGRRLLRRWRHGPRSISEPLAP